MWVTWAQQALLPESFKESPWRAGGNSLGDPGTWQALTVLWAPARGHPLGRLLPRLISWHFLSHTIPASVILSYLQNLQEATHLLSLPSPACMSFPLPEHTLAELFLLWWKRPWVFLQVSALTSLPLESLAWTHPKMPQLCSPIPPDIFPNVTHVPLNGMTACCLSPH